MCIATFLALTPLMAAPTLEIRKITPPKLDSLHLGPQITCHRPMRHGAPNMSVTKQNEQIIAHNYGHGGSGWTLGPGSAQHVNDLLLTSEYAHEITKEHLLPFLEQALWDYLVPTIFTKEDLRISRLLQKSLKVLLPILREGSWLLSQWIITLKSKRPSIKLVLML